MTSTVHAKRRRASTVETITTASSSASDSDVEIIETSAPSVLQSLSCSSRKRTVADRDVHATAKQQSSGRTTTPTARVRSIPVTQLPTTIEHHSPTCYTLHLPVVNSDHSSATLYTQLDGAISVDAALFDELWNLHPAEYGSIKMYGKTILTPRWHAVYGSREYKFSGVAHPALPIPPPQDGKLHYFQRLIDWVSNHSGHNGYDSLLVNWYADSTHYMGTHTDDESSLVKNAPIYSFSFGAARDFIIHDRKNLKLQHTLNLPNNSLLIMREAMQRYYKHSVPKSKILSGRRINITLRHFKK